MASSLPVIMMRTIVDLPADHIAALAPSHHWAEMIEQVNSREEKQPAQEEIAAFGRSRSRCRPGVTLETPNREARQSLMAPGRRVPAGANLAQTQCAKRQTRCSPRRRFRGLPDYQFRKLRSRSSLYFWPRLW